MRESLILNGLIRYLAVLERQNKLYYIRNNSFSGYIQQRNGYKSYIQNAKRGTPDIVLCLNGYFVGLEVKSETGKQSPDQKNTENTIKSIKGYYYIIRSIDDLQKVLKEFGL